jgi:hypothetical protein
MTDIDIKKRRRNNVSHIMLSKHGDIHLTGADFMKGIRSMAAHDNHHMAGELLAALKTGKQDLALVHSNIRLLCLEM